MKTHPAFSVRPFYKSRIWRSNGKNVFSEDTRDANLPIHVAVKSIWLLNGLI